MSQKNKQDLSTYARERSHKIVAAIRAAMETIENEVRDSNGIYPHNKGRLTMAEVCRRARVHPITMMGGAHKTTTRPMIMAWIRDLKKSMITGRKGIRRAVTESVIDWKAQYTSIATQFKEMYSVEIPRRDAQIKNALERIEELEKQNLDLTAALSEKVVKLSSATKKK